jgi:ADP-heptose:LPS heptosyltransferase
MRWLRTGLGVGDVLLATGILRAWRRLHNQPVIVETRYPELFQHNPYVRAIWRTDTRPNLTAKLFDHRFIWRVGNRVNHWFDKHLLKPTYPFPCRGKHLIDAMAETLGIELQPGERRPFLHLTDRERATQSWAHGWIAVQSSSTTYWTMNKHWIPGRMQQVVNEISAMGYAVVQLGAAQDDALEGVKDLRGKTTLRESAAILANVRLLIGLEGGLVHLARSVDTRAAVIYTGYTRPEETGYAENINLRDPNAGEGCWRRDPCEHCAESARWVTVERVLKAMGDALSKGPLSGKLK